MRMATVADVMARLAEDLRVQQVRARARGAAGVPYQGLQVDALTWGSGETRIGVYTAVAQAEKDGLVTREVRQGKLVVKLVPLKKGARS